MSRTVDRTVEDIDTAMRGTPPVGARVRSWSRLTGDAQWAAHNVAFGACDARAWDARPLPTC